MSRRAMVVALLLAGCGESPMGPASAEPFEPFAWFDDAYREMEDCTNVDGDPYRLRWFGVLNYRQFGADSIEVVRDPPFTVEWRRPHDIFLGYSVVDDVPGAVTVYVWEAALRDLLQTNNVPEWAHDACGIELPA